MFREARMRRTYSQRRSSMSAMQELREKWYRKGVEWGRSHTAPLSPEDEMRIAAEMQHDLRSIGANNRYMESFLDELWEAFTEGAEDGYRWSRK